MSTHHYVFVVVCITLSIAFHGDMYLTEAVNGGFSIELIHRDSPKSPFYNSSETHIERKTNAIRRSYERVKQFYQEYGASYRAVHAPLSNADGEYLMKFSIGTPKFDVVTTIDTGSDLVWVQCKPCKNCYKQSDPIFNPSKSKTYEVAPCNSHACQLIKRNSCLKAGKSSKCQYQESYLDESSTSGDVAHETFTFGTTGVDKVIFGCGYNNQGHYNRKSGGIVGLGNGPISLTSQLGAKMDNKFSYCFSPHNNKRGLISFGEKAVVSGPGTVSTPLVSDPSSTFYFLNLKGMSVAGKRLDFINRGSIPGKILLDTGTTVTFLPSEFYNKLKSLVASQINLTPSKQSFIGDKLCYEYKPTFKAPPITVHFAGADVVLKQENIFEPFGNLMCFNFDVNDDHSIYGNTLQFDFHVGIDRQKKIVSFKPTECSKLQS